MAEIVRNLFGIDPTALQQQQADTDFARAYRFAQLDPFERANMALYQSGAQIARGTGQLLGGDDQLNRATQIRQLASEVDFSDPDSIDAFVQRVAPLSPTVAADAAKRSADLKLTAARTVRASREAKTPTSPLGKLLTERDELIAGGLALNDPRILAYDKAIAATGEAPKGTTVKVDLTGPRNVLEVDKADAANLVKARDALEKSVPLLQSSLNALDKGIIGGAFSNARVAFNTALSSAGLSPIKNIEALANTKTFNANRIALASSIAKQLGVNPTDRDFQASLDRFAAASEDPRASKIFLTELLALQQQQLADANAGLEYFRRNQGSFSGYNRPLPKAFSAGPDLSNLSDDQLRQAINERKKANQK